MTEIISQETNTEDYKLHCIDEKHKIYNENNILHIEIPLKKITSKDLQGTYAGIEAKIEFTTIIKEIIDSMIDDYFENIYND